MSTEKDECEQFSTVCVHSAKPPTGKTRHVCKQMGAFSVTACSKCGVEVIITTAMSHLFPHWRNKSLTGTSHQQAVNNVTSRIMFSRQVACGFLLRACVHQTRLLIARHTLLDETRLFFHRFASPLVSMPRQCWTSTMQNWLPTISR